MTLELGIAFPKNQLSEEATAAVLERVKAILARGHIARFSRPHRLAPEITVAKNVSKLELDDMGDLESDNGWVAPWDAAYTLEEIEK